ncbi:hypothetical protein ACFTZK_38090 [Streptomyces decoyicus]|uniref:hypothetical protein n=1 Tax=Streptomyces decoyicus TaxID=249567 RepID=UPI00362B38EF
MAGVAVAPAAVGMVNDQTPNDQDQASAAAPVYDAAPPVTGSAAGRSAVGLRVGGVLPGPIAAGA